MNDHESTRMAIVAFSEIMTCGDLDAAKQIAGATLAAIRKKKLASRIDVDSVEMRRDYHDEESTHP